MHSLMATSENIASIFHIENPRLEGHVITILYRVGENNLKVRAWPKRGRLRSDRIGNGCSWQRITMTPTVGHLNKMYLEFNNGVTATVSPSMAPLRSATFVPWGKDIRSPTP